MPEPCSSHANYITLHVCTMHYVAFALHCIALHCIPSHHITSHHITSHHITSHHTTSHRITSHHITSHHIPPQLPGTGGPSGELSIANYQWIWCRLVQSGLSGLICSNVYHSSLSVVRRRFTCSCELPITPHPCVCLFQVFPDMPVCLLVSVCVCVCVCLCARVCMYVQYNIICYTILYYNK